MIFRSGVVVLCGTILLASCSSNEVLQDDVQSAGYFSLRSFIEEDIAIMTKEDVTLKKIFVINGDQDNQVVDSVDWNLELHIFKLADIDNILYEGQYEKQNDGTKSTTYTAVDDDLRTRKVMINFEPFFESGNSGMPDYKVKSILIDRKIETLIYTTEEKLAYTPEEGYVIDYKHNVIFLKPERVRIVGNFEYQESNEKVVLDSIEVATDSNTVISDSVISE